MVGGGGLVVVGVGGRGCGWVGVGGVGWWGKGGLYGGWCLGGRDLWVVGERVGGWGGVKRGVNFSNIVAVLPMGSQKGKSSPDDEHMRADKKRRPSTCACAS